MSQVPVFTGTITKPIPWYTNCVEADSYEPTSQYLKAALAGIITAAISVAIVAATGIPWLIPFAVELTAMAGGLAYCDWWLNDRLICLPGDETATTGPPVDVCMVGMFVSSDQDPVSAIPFAVGDLDNDWTMDLVVYGTEPGQPNNILQVEDTAMTTLIPKTQGVGQTGLSFENNGQGQTTSWLIRNLYTGQSMEQANGGTTFTSYILHAEVEGPGIKDFQSWLTALFFATVAALLVALAVSALPVVGPAVAAILAALMFLLSLLGFYMSESDQANQPNPTGPNGSQAIPIQGPSGLNGAQPATVLCVIGRWSYDSAHDGWNEIHPVKSVQVLGTMDGADPNGFSWGTAWADQCQAMNAATSTATLVGQLQPANGWHIHPVLDGCGPYPPPAPPPDPPVNIQ
jgi:hypothetical protein